MTTPGARFALSFHMRAFLVFCCLAVFLVFPKAFGGTSPYPGYVADVESEKSQRFYEVYLFVTPPPQKQSLQEVIFNPLRTEFKTKYREKFGEVDTESMIYRPSALGGTNDSPQALEEQNKKRREFAEYMTRRMAEYHFDNYMRTQPQMKPVMEVKDKIQNVKVEVNKEVRMNIQYNYAGNMADVIVDNPWCESKVSLEMNPHAFGPTSLQETRLWIAKQLSARWRANSNVAATDGIAAADLTRAFIRAQAAVTLGLSSPFKESGTSAREVRYLLGFSQAF